MPNPPAHAIHKSVTVWGHFSTSWLKSQNSSLTNHFLQQQMCFMQYHSEHKSKQRLNMLLNVAWVTVWMLEFSGKPDALHYKKFPISEMDQWKYDMVESLNIEWVWVNRNGPNIFNPDQNHGKNFFHAMLPPMTQLQNEVPMCNPASSSVLFHQVGGWFYIFDLVFQWKWSTSTDCSQIFLKVYLTPFHHLLLFMLKTFDRIFSFWCYFL